MKYIQLKDEKVTNFIHDNGSETSIKLALSGKYDSMLNLNL